MNSYVLIDRSSLIKYAISIDDAQFRFDVSTDAVRSEPILKDTTLSNKYYRCFISDKEFAFEETSTVRDDSIVLYDNVLNVYYKLYISDAQFWYDVYTISVLTRLKVASEKQRLNTISDRTRLLVATETTRLKSCSVQNRLLVASNWARLKESNKLDN